MPPIPPEETAAGDDVGRRPRPENASAASSSLSRPRRPKKEEDRDEILAPASAEATSSTTMRRRPRARAPADDDGAKGSGSGSVADVGGDTATTGETGRNGPAIGETGGGATTTTTAAGARTVRSVRVTTSLPVLVAMDMLAVSLVVPLLHQYYRSAGVSSARQRELLSSLFSSSQILGGVSIGALSDSGTLSRTTVLLVSFVGSAVAYLLISVGGIWAVVVSRLLVGFVKQTMTVSTAILARHTTKEERATQMGRLSASSTVAWIVGPSAGAVLYRHCDRRAPALVACGLFATCAVAAVFVLPRDDGAEGGGKGEKRGNDATGDDTGGSTAPPSTDGTAGAGGGISKLVSNLRCCFQSKCLAAVVACQLLFHWVSRTTSYGNIATYYEAMYGVEPHVRGYLASYKAGLTFLAQSFLVGPVSRGVGGEVNAACLSALVMSVVTAVETRASFATFLCVLCPMISVSVAVLGASLKSVVTHVAPRESLGSILAAIDVLSNAAAVTVPFYRTVLFTALATSDGDDDGMGDGDPDPVAWLASSAAHWLVASGLMCCLLLRGNPCADAMSVDGCDGRDVDVDKKDR